MAEAGTITAHWTIIIADDHPLVRDAVKHALLTQPSAITVVDVGSLPEALAALDCHDGVDLVLLDLNMPGMDGFTGLTRLRAAHPAVPAAILSATTEVAVMRRAIEFGAAGFIPKSSALPVIAEAIARILDGEIWLPEAAREPTGAEAACAGDLTPQQMKVLAMVAKGLLNKQIAYELGVGEATIKAHVTAILRKLGVHSRTQAVIAARLLDLQGQS